MKNITVLGSTGSIGQQTLSVVRAFPQEFRIIALCAGKNSEELIRQAREFSPRYVGLFAADATLADKLREALPGVSVVYGEGAASELAQLPEADIVVNGVNGFSGTLPLLSALGAGKTVALANKESIICAHGLVEAALNGGGGSILPVDSEQSAFFQCIQGSASPIARLVLTASGGPFKNWGRDELAWVTPEMAVKHPMWSMGRKISLDSATLFNKGLEIMEACYLFNVPESRVQVVIHPEATVHSLVGFEDGSYLAQLSRPDMRLAIQYALTWPQRLPGDFGGLDLLELGKLSFQQPDEELFRALPLAREAMKNDALPIAYNAACEVADERFFGGELGFLDIQDCVEYTMGRTENAAVREFGDVLALDEAARRVARTFRKETVFQF